MRRTALGALATAALTAPAPAQEAMYTAAATMPSPGVVIFRPQLNFWEYGSNPVDGTDLTQRLEVLTSVQVGIARALSLTLDIPVEIDRRRLADGSGGGVDHDRGVQDLGLSLKWRVFKNDTGGIETVRLAIIGGIHFPSGDDDDYSGGDVTPHLGAVLTMVRGRHGFNQEIAFRLSTGGGEERNVGGGSGDASTFYHNTAYLYRISPERYTADTKGSFYVTAELNGIYETNGDYELKWSPGLMYEAADFAIELMAQFPLYQHVRERAELDFGVGIGVRLTF